MESFVVVRRVTPVREKGRIQVRTFGPYDRNEATRVSDRLKRKAVTEMWASRAEISICRLRPSVDEVL